MENLPIPDLHSCPALLVGMVITGTRFSSLIYADCRFSKAHHFWEQSAIFLAKWRLLSSWKSIFMLHFKFQQLAVSSFDKKRGASNAWRSGGRDMSSICETQKCWKYFPHVWKTEQNEAHRKTSEFILIGNNMKNSTVASVQLELNRTCFLTWTRTQQGSQIILAELFGFCEYKSRTSCGLSPVTWQDPWAIWTFSADVEGPVIPTKVWLIVLH